MRNAQQAALVQAALEQFPGARIVAVKDVFDVAAEITSSDDPEIEPGYDQ